MEVKALCAQCRKENPNRASRCGNCGGADFVWRCPSCGSLIPFLKTRRVLLVAVLGAAAGVALSTVIYAFTDESQLLPAVVLGAFAGLFLGQVDWHTLRHMVLPFALHDGRLTFEGKSCARAWGIREPLSQGGWASVVCTAAVVVGFGDWTYGYYRLLRLLLCGVSLFLLTGDKSRLQDWHRWLLIGLAVLYNPVIPVELRDRGLWSAVNVATLVVFWIVSLREVRPRSGT